MIYEIAGLRVFLDNQYPFTTQFCKEYLSVDQQSAVDIRASITQEEFEREKEASPGFSDGYIENICLYRNLCYQLPSKNRFLMHSSVLEYDGNGYAFLGRSGTGKSTHTKLWLKYLQNTRVINGDKPILEYTGKEIIVHGTPWQGKERWGCKASVALRGFCFLEQAKQNAIQRLSFAQVTSRLFTQLLLPEEEGQVSATLDLADKLIRLVPAYLLQCDISQEAVKTCFEEMTGKIYEKCKKENQDEN